MKKLVYFCLFFCFVASGYATHNRAGQISYKHISNLTYEFTVTIFADPTSQAINRREIEIDWGDNTGVDSVQNNLPNTVVVPGRIIKRTWTARHTFLGPGDYTISVSDRNRNGGVENISNSSAVPFYVETVLRVFPISGIYNDSPDLLNDPIDDACLGSTFIHNPGAVDPDGDSLAYSISESFGINGNIASGFTFPPATNRIYVDELTGDLIWENPAQTGIYNVAIKISEYRNGVFLGSVLRDLQIQVYAGCNNVPPSVSLNRFVCGEAGSNISVPIQGFDQDNDLVTLSYTGEIFESSIVGDTAFVNRGVPGNPTSDLLVWNTSCDDIRVNPYSYSIKATDDGQTRGLTDLTYFDNGTIKVVGPAVKNFIATTLNRDIILNWDTANCSNALGYNIYRRVDSSNYVPGSCQTGVPESTGYILIARINDISVNSYLDNDSANGLVPGQNYCYLITSRFQGEEGYASSETCAIVDKYVPLMTAVSVLRTSVDSGQISLSWSPPDTSLFNNIQGPFKYIISQRLNNQSIIIDSTLSFVDTTYQISNINTLENSYSYKVELRTNNGLNEFVGKSAWASSVYLSITPTDNQLTLSWTKQVPWNNTSFVIYRKNSADLFDSIAVTNTTQYVDTGLANETQYCYYIKTIGNYNLNNVKSPIINLSQENCAAPIDDELPCSPQLSSNSDCNINLLSLNWNNPNLTCANGIDIVGYRIYRSDSSNGIYELINIIDNPTTTKFSSNLSSIAGCYRITAIDSSANESLSSNIVCIDYCPIYELPNVFTPNGDGLNDLFVPLGPFNYRYVESIDIVIYNRWGERVFSTNNPDILWDGKHQNINPSLKNLKSAIDNKTSLVKSGVYYYRCIVNELSLDGIKPRLLKGTITVLDSKEKDFK